MPHGSITRPTRRGVLAAGGALGLGALLAACGRDASDAADGTKAWSFTDDRGRKVSTSGRPKRIVAFTGTAAALWDYGIRDQIVGVFGETRTLDGKPTPLAGNLDVNRVQIVGNAFGEFDVEKYAALRPDLLVTDMYVPGKLWYVPDKSAAQIAKLAPSVGISAAYTPITQPIQRHAALAAALGADLDAKQVVADRTRFQNAVQSLTSAIRANPGITVMAASAATSLFYVSNPRYDSDLIYYGQLGLRFVTPSKFDQGDYFQGLSWENAGTYRPDLIMLDNRGTSLQPKDLAGNPAWTSLPAVKAGQVTPWDTVPRFSHAGVAPDIERLAAAVRSAKRLS